MRSALQRLPQSENLRGPLQQGDLLMHLPTQDRKAAAIRAATKARVRARDIPLDRGHKVATKARDLKGATRPERAHKAAIRHELQVDMEPVPHVIKLQDHALLILPALQAQEDMAAPVLVDLVLQVQVVLMEVHVLWAHRAMISSALSQPKMNLALLRKNQKMPSASLLEISATKRPQSVGNKIHAYSMRAIAKGYALIWKTKLGAKGALRIKCALFSKKRSSVPKL